MHSGMAAMPVASILQRGRSNTSGTRWYGLTKTAVNLAGITEFALSFRTIFMVVSTMMQDCSWNFTKCIKFLEKASETQASTSHSPPATFRQRAASATYLKRLNPHAVANPGP